MQFARLVTEMSNVTDHIAFHSCDNTDEFRYTSHALPADVFPVIEVIRGNPFVLETRRDNDDDG